MPFIEFDGELDSPGGFVPFDGELDEPVIQRRRGGTRSESSAAISTTTARGAGGFNEADPRRLDRSPNAGPPSVLDKPRRSDNVDPLLSQDFVAQLRQDFEALPEGERLSALRNMTLRTDGYGRAAKQILREVEVENANVRETMAEKGALVDLVQRAPQVPRETVSRAGTRPASVAMPEVNEVERLARGETTDQALARDRAGRVVDAADRSPEAIAARAELRARDFEAEAFAADNPLTGALASGAARQLRGAVNIVPTALDFAARLAGIDTTGINSEGDFSANLKRQADSLMPKVGRQGMDTAWDKGEFGGWLLTNLVAQAPQIAQSVIAAFVPGAQGMALTAMGAQAAGNKFADTGRSDAAVLSGLVEAGSEMMPLHAFHRSYEALRALPAAARGELIQAVGRAIPAVGKAVTLQGVVGAIEEAAAEIGNNVIDNTLLGENKRLLDGVAEAAVIGAFASGAMSLPQGAGALGRAAQSPERQFARALQADVADTSFVPGAIEGYARRAATDPKFFDPTFVDPGRGADNSNPVQQESSAAAADSAPGVQQSASPSATAPAVQTPSETAARLPRVQDMPTEPLTPEQIAALAEQARADRIGQGLDQQGPTPAEIRPAGAPHGDGRGQDIAEAKIAAPSGRQQAVQPVQPGTGEQVPAIQRGSLAAEAQRALDARQLQARQAAPTSTNAVPQAPLPVETERQSRAPKPDARGGASAVSSMPPSAAPQAVPSPEGRTRRRTRQRLAEGVRGSGEDFPVFATRGQAYTWAVERRRSQELEPAAAGERWTLRRRGEPASDAPARSAAAQTRSLTTDAAAHVDPGHKPGAATPPVIDASFAKAARTENRRPSIMRTELIGKIESALADAKADDDPAVLALRRWDANPANVKRLQSPATSKAAEAERRGLVLAVSSAAPAASTGATGLERGSASIKAAIEAMLDEGDAQGAVDYAAAKGVDINELGLSPARRARLTGINPTPQPSDNLDAAGHKPDAESRAAPPAPTPAQAPAAPLAPVFDDGRQAHELTASEFEAQAAVTRGIGSKPWTASWRGRAIADEQGQITFATRKAAVTALRAAHQRAVERAASASHQVDGDGGGHAASAPESAAADTNAHDYAATAAIVGRWRADGYRALKGRRFDFPLKIEETGAVAVLHIEDAADFFRKKDEDEDAARSGVVEGHRTELFAQAIARYVAAGVDTAAARQQGLLDVIADIEAWRHDAVAELRKQQPDLFTDRIDDAGEKIGGARKDRWADRGMNLADLDGMSESEGAQLVTKAAVWKPDYLAMVEAGTAREAAAMIKVIFDQLAAKPKNNTPEGRRDYVQAIQAVRQVYNQAKTTDQVKSGYLRLRELLGVESRGYGLSAEQQAARRVLFSVYKGRSDPFAIGYNEIARATKLVAAGFPDAVEPWTRHLVVRQIGGAGISPRGVELYAAEAEKLGTPLTAVQLRAGAWRVTDKAGRVQAYASTKADAEAAAKTVYERQRSTPDGKAEPQRPHLEKVVRAGLPSAIDRDVTAEDFITEYGFRGVEWGNWAAQDERQKIANLAFDALADLARILSIPPQALSLNGTLGLAFGARGGGRFAAHYEPGKLVINVTKLRGAGSLAHEWAHAFDHYLGELDRDDAYKTTPRGASGWYSPARYGAGAERNRLGNLRPELADRIEAVMRALYTGQQSKPDMLKEMGTSIARAETNAAKADGEMKAMFTRQAEQLREARKAIEADPDDATYPKGRSMFAVEAQKLSGKSSQGYWLRPTEMFARAFEAYVFDRIAAMGAQSEYLVHGVEPERYTGGGYRGNPYPTGEERAAIDRAFDALVTELKTRTSDDGKVALFHRRMDDSAERAALKALAENDELFALPRSDANTVEGVAADIDPTITVTERSVPGRQQYDLKMPDSSVARLMVRKPSSFGPTVYGFDLVEGEMSSLHESRPGENPEDVDPDTEDVWIDVSLLKPGGNGTAVYSIAANFAHNTGRIFIGDPAGLSNEAMRRRSEHMLSSALKFGTTAHLAPHPRQVTGDRAIGVPPLRWVYGDDLGNVRRLVELNLAALDTAMPSARKLDFDASTGQFLNTDTGRPVQRVSLARPVERSWVGGMASAALAGRTTLARGAVLRALLREEGRGGEAGGRRDGLLARLVRLATESVGATKGLFYSRTGSADGASLTPDGVRAVVTEITSAWANAPGIRVVASMAQAPEAARRENERQLAEGASGVPSAFWLEGRVYLVASELHDRRAVAEAIAHEALAHQGLRGVFGPELGKVLADVARLREADVRAKAERYGLNLADEAQRLRAAEEVLAELAQREPKSSLVQRAIAAIRAWLREHIPMLADMRLSDAELIERYIAPARQWVIDGRAAAAEPSVAFQRNAGRQEVAPFYSALEREVEGMSLKAAEAPVWRAQVLALTKRGTKREEIEWSGLLDWLDMQRGRISKADVLAYLQANGVRVEQHQLGGESATPKDVKVEQSIDDKGSPEWSVVVKGYAFEQASTREEAERIAEELRADRKELALHTGVRFPGHAQPGAMNHREIVLTLPGQAKFESAHWRDTPNVLAHVRFNERSDIDGKRVLFVEELQSDWSNELRADRRAGGNAVPDAPFVGNDAWVALALKATIRAAVANGFDRVAFSTGKQVAKMFPFSDGERGDGTIRARSRFYGEADGTVIDDMGAVMAGRTPILQNVATDVLKRLGGGGLTTIELRAPRKRKPVPQIGFVITPALRKAASEGMPLFSRSVDSFRSWLESPGKRSVTITDSVQRSETDPAARADAWKPTDPGFAEWFDGSKIVDAAGAPRIVHGMTNTSGRFPALPVGVFGSGRYFTTDPSRAAPGGEVAGFYSAGGSQPAYLALKNPYVYEGARIAMPEGWTEPKNLSADVRDRLRSQMRSPAAELIQKIMPAGTAEQMLARVFHGKVDLGDTIAKRLKEMDHDGLIVRFADPKDGPETIVAFDANQVRKAAGQGEAGSDGPVLFQRAPTSFTLRQFGRAGRLVEVVQDRYNRWKQAIEDISEQGGSVTEASDFYKAEERYWGQVGSRIDDFEGELKAFVKAVATDGLDLADVALYAYAQHAEERNEYIASINPKLPDGGSGMTTDDADTILAEAREAGLEAQLQRHAQTLRDWIAGTRAVLRDGGLISDDEFDAWTNAYAHYVPLRGLDGVTEGMATGKGYSIRGPEGRQAHGRRSLAKNIIEHIVQDRVRSLVRVGKNEVLRSFARFVMDNPSLNLWEVNAVETRPAIVVDENGDRTVVDRETVVADQRTVTLKDAGQEIHILVKDRKLLEQLRHHGIEQNPTWPVAALLWANRLLSRLYTSLSPTFTVINFLRDVQTAAFGVIDEIGFLAAPKLFAALPKALAESFAAEAGKKSAEYQLFETLGGKTSFHALRTIDDQARELQRMLHHEERAPIDPRNAIPAALHLIEVINGGIENATRLAAFKVARGAGRSAAESASIAKNITVNFNRRGQQQLASAWFLFFNPAVQGTARIIQSLAHPKVQITIGMAMLGAAALALRNAGMGDDDDGVAWWDKIPEEVKERNLIIVLPPGASAGEQVPKSKTGRYVKVPMPYGYNFFAVVANQIVDAWRHAQDPRRGRDVLGGAAKAFNAFMGSWLPVDDLGRALSPETGEGAGKSAVLALVPDALDPFAQIGLNWSGFGRKLYPDDPQSRFMPDASRYFPSQAGTIFQRGAQTLNQATGGNRYSSGAIDLTPAALETLARAYGGGPVSFGLDIVNAMYARQSIERPDLEAKRLPFLKQAWGTIDAETDRLVGYQRLEQADRITEPIKRAIRQGAREEARELRDQAGPMARLGDAVQLTREHLAEVRKAELKVIDDPKMTDGAKYARLLELAERRRKVLHRFNAKFDEAVLATTKSKEKP